MTPTLGAWVKMHKGGMREALSRSQMSNSFIQSCVAILRYEEREEHSKSRVYCPSNCAKANTSKEMICRRKGEKELCCSKCKKARRLVGIFGSR